MIDLSKIFSIRIKKDNKYVMTIFGIQLTFPKLNSDYLSKKEWINFVIKVNGAQYADEGSSLYYLRNKTILLNRLKENLGRDFLVIDEHSYDEFINFTNKHKKFVAKVIDSSFGLGISVIDTNSCQESLQDIFNQLIENKQFLLEEYVFQHDSLMQIYPYSLSTIRICTLKIGDDVDIVGIPILRIGGSKLLINSTDVMMTQIDVETGILFGSSLIQRSNEIWFDENNIHPDTKKSIKGYKIPYFKEVVELAKRTALLVPEINFIGWDIAITNDGPVVIEGNGGPQSYNDEQKFSYNQNGHGVKKYYLNLARLYEIKKSLTEEKISKINSILYAEESEIIEKPNYVFILGSKKCSNRAQEACKKFALNRDIFYILSGGNYVGNLQECEVMKNVLEENGVLEKQILMDRKAKYTKQNIINSFEIIDKHNNKNIEKPIITIVSADFHINRIKYLIKILKLDKKYKINYLHVHNEKTSKKTWFNSLYGVNIIFNELKKYKMDSDLI